MSRRVKKVELVEPESELIPEPEEEEEMEYESADVQNAPIVEVRVCKSCGSVNNLFKRKASKICIECLELREKKAPTERQLRNCELMRERKRLKTEERKKEIAEFEKKAKEELDSKIVKKAISIKKKQIKASAELDEISDDDTPLEQIVEVAKTRTKRTSAKTQNAQPIRQAPALNRTQSYANVPINNYNNMPKVNFF